MKRVLILLGIGVILLLLDNTIVPFFAIKGFYPNLLFLFALFYSILSDEWEALWFGVYTGLLQDLYFFNGFGINALTNMMMCLIAAVIGRSIFKEKGLIPAVSSFVLSLIKGILVFVILFFVGVHINPANIIFNSIYNMIIAIFMYKFVYKLCVKDYMQKKWKFYD